MKPSQRRRLGGFTLIELMVALGIFMVIGLLSYRALASIIDSRDRVGIEQKRWSSVTRFMQRLEIDLQQVARGTSDSVVYDASHQTLRLIRLAPNIIGDDTRTIRYRWREGRIERDERKTSAPPFSSDSSEMVEPEVVLDSAQEMEWLWAGAKPENGTEMLWQAAPDKAGALPPAALRLRLKLADIPGDLIRVIALR